MIIVILVMMIIMVLGCHLGQLVHHTDQQGGHCQHHRQIHLVSVLCVNVNVRFTELEVRAKEDF